jgi:SAM-dependent methyltransferase
MAASRSSKRPRPATAIARRVAHSRPGQRLIEAISDGPKPVPDDLDVDTWLRGLYGEELAALDEACSGGAGPEALARFRDLDDDLWTLLLLRQYESYPNIRALLPEMPEAELQRFWNGASGLTLMNEAKAFYRHVKAMAAAHGPRPLAESRVLDFGCGWGRITRFFARDVAPGALLGVDPSEEILAVCRRHRVPAELARSEFLPESLPFADVDVAYAFSVFTHLSEAAAESCLTALHGSLSPGGLLIATIRPPGYLERDPDLRAAVGGDGDPVEVVARRGYVFAPDDPEGHPQYGGGEMAYGDTVVSLAHVRDRWSDRFELLDVKVSAEDMFQVSLTLKKRD